MNTSDLLQSLSPPALHLVEETTDAFSNLTRSLAVRNNVVVRTVRGKKSRTTAAFFDEAAAALQFPYYFGENWNAFDEMLVDLDWLPGDAYLLMIPDAEALLASAADDDYRILMKTLARARAEWLTPNIYIPRSRPPTPFHVVLQAATAEARIAIISRLERAGEEYDHLQPHHMVGG